MKRLIIQTRKFSATLDELVRKNKVSEEVFEDLERELVRNPELGEPIQGTGGVRKTRLRSTSGGKRGGFRVCYCDVPEKGRLFLLVVYAKNEKENLTKDEQGLLKSLVRLLKKE